MDPDDPPKTIRIEKRPIDERNVLGHGIEKTEVGIKQQDPGEDQRKVRHEIGDPTKRLENFAAGHVGARMSQAKTTDKIIAGIKRTTERTKLIHSALNVPGSE